MILDILRFVNNLVKKLLPFIESCIPFQQIIRSNQHIRLLIVLKLSPPLLLSPCDQQKVKFRGELTNFFPPVQHQRSRSYDQRHSFSPFLLRRKQYRNHLKSLPKSHIIRQYSAEPKRL